jgi:hypothetical protein
MFRTAKRKYHFAALQFHPKYLGKSVFLSVSQKFFFLEKLSEKGPEKARKYGAVFGPYFLSNRPQCRKSHRPVKCEKSVILV